MATQPPPDEPTWKHCDDYIDDPTAPEVLRTYLGWARAPAYVRIQSSLNPRLFATFRGKRVRIVMASRLGDVGITENLQAEHGYSTRVAVEDLTDFADVE